MRRFHSSPFCLESFFFPFFFSFAIWTGQGGFERIIGVCAGVHWVFIHIYIFLSSFAFVRPRSQTLPVDIS